MCCQEHDSLRSGKFELGANGPCPGRQCTEDTLHTGGRPLDRGSSLAVVTLT